MKKILYLLAALVVLSPMGGFAQENNMQDGAEKTEDSYDEIDGSFRPTGNVHIDKIHMDMSDEQRKEMYIQKKKQEDWLNSLDEEEKQYWKNQANKIFSHPEYKKHLRKNLKIMNHADRERIRAQLDGEIPFGIQ